MSTAWERKREKGMLCVSAFNLPLQWIFLWFISLVSVKKSSELHWCLLPACILLATQIHHVTLTSDHTAKNVRTLSSFTSTVRLLSTSFPWILPQKSWFSHAVEWDFPPRPSRPWANLYHFSKATGRYRILNKPNMHKNLTVSGAKTSEAFIGVIWIGHSRWGSSMKVSFNGSFRRDHSGRVIQGGHWMVDGSFVVEVMCLKSNFTCNQVVI